MVEIEPGTTPTQFIVRADKQTTVQMLTSTLSKLGVMTGQGEGYVDGKVKYGWNPAKIRFTYTETDRGTSVTTQLPRKFAHSKAGRNIVDRFKDALANANNPAFKPDRFGASPAAMIGGILLILVVVIPVAWLIGGLAGGGF